MRPAAFLTLFAALLVAPSALARELTAKNCPRAACSYAQNGAVIPGCPPNFACVCGECKQPCTDDYYCQKLNADTCSFCVDGYCKAACDSTACQLVKCANGFECKCGQCVPVCNQQACELIRCAAPNVCRCGECVPPCPEPAIIKDPTLEPAFYWQLKGQGCGVDPFKVLCAEGFTCICNRCVSNCNVPCTPPPPCACDRVNPCAPIPLAKPNYYCACDSCGKPPFQIDCAPCYHCEAGGCYPDCPKCFPACKEGTQCSCGNCVADPTPSTLFTGCELVKCRSGFHCVAGQCLNDCDLPCVLNPCCDALPDGTFCKPPPLPPYLQYCPCPIKPPPCVPNPCCDAPPYQPCDPPEPLPGQELCSCPPPPCTPLPSCACPGAKFTCSPAPLTPPAYYCDSCLPCCGPGPGYDTIPPSCSREPPCPPYRG